MMCNDIQIAIEQHSLDMQLSVFSPKYNDYLRMEDDLKVLENAIASSKNILQINEVKEKRDELEASLIDFLTEWSR